ncbi:hypothetical protein PsorP6_008151 [Peronosclerospora sorghi]|uniref:Uncharacterized protein n=1 Tax=Peronosclerospora sorghi TaxID=230839 RepID=A0ACC0W8C7_9STRA|nr:hypothetical protein PsorP6_008151 [Peronosclerospora sorghi]
MGSLIFAEGDSRIQAAGLWYPSGCEYGPPTLKRFCVSVMNVFEEEYLRSPTEEDLTVYTHRGRRLCKRYHGHKPEEEEGVYTDEVSGIFHYLMRSHSCLPNCRKLHARMWKERLGYIRPDLLLCACRRILE